VSAVALRYLLAVGVGFLLGLLGAGRPAAAAPTAPAHHTDRPDGVRSAAATVADRPDGIIPPAVVVAALVRYRWRPERAAGLAAAVPAWHVLALGYGGGQFVPDGFGLGPRRVELGSNPPDPLTIEHEYHHAADWLDSRTPGRWDFDGMRAATQALAAQHEDPRVAAVAARILAERPPEDAWHDNHFLIARLGWEFRAVPEAHYRRWLGYGSRGRAVLPAVDR
jgi:hypothetical protein